MCVRGALRLSVHDLPLWKLTKLYVACFSNAQASDASKHGRADVPACVRLCTLEAVVRALVHADIFAHTPALRVCLHEHYTSKANGTSNPLINVNDKGINMKEKYQTRRTYAPGRPCTVLTQNNMSCNTTCYKKDTCNTK
eukprot:6174929-Pleurochrysis_carterae.AAC.2